MALNELELFNALSIQRLAANCQGDVFGPSPEAILAAGKVVDKYKREHPLFNTDEYYSTMVAKELAKP